MESYKTFAEDGYHHILVANVVSGNTECFSEYELTIDYNARVIVIKLIK